MHRFLVSPESIQNDAVLLDKKESHHARNVLRVKLGEAVEVLDGRGGKFRAVVAGFDDGRVALSVDRRLPAGRQASAPSASGIEITLAPCVIKPERMEWMLEKACELGVRRWTPVIAERSVVRLSRERWQAKTERWRRLAEQSCKQCGQADVPALEAPTPLREIISRIGEHDLSLIPTLTVPSQDLKQALAKRAHASKLLILIGPEGDFTKKEAESAVSAGAVAVDLGPLVLRAETAAVFALSAAQFFYRTRAAS